MMRTMQLAANGIRLELEDHGAPDAEPLVMIMGLGMQLTGWPDELVQLLVARGFRVIRFDNRDIGRSQWFDHLGVPNLPVVAFRAAFGLPVAAPYGLADMAADTAGLLDALGLPAAHVVGASMGGMIAQHVAARHPARVKSLTLMMTTSGARRLPQPSLRVRSVLLARPPRGAAFDDLLAHYLHLYDVIGSPAFRNERDALAGRIAASLRRSYHPAGVARQLVAIAADGDRSPLLARIAAPTLVLHGRDDPLVPVAAAHDLAAKIAQAGLDVVDGWGHDLPAALWPRIVDGITRTAERSR